MKKLALALLLVAAVLVVAAPTIAAQPMCGGSPATIVGTNGDDEIWGTNGDDVIVARDGNDYISPRSGNDKICGGPGDDTIIGGWGNDEIYGGTGSDIIEGNYESDVIRGGPGNDRISGDSRDGTFDHAPGADVIFGGAGRDVIRAGDGDDFVSGGAGSDKIYGQSGGDQLFGRGGNDVLAGGSGEDSVVGDRGQDRCSAEDVDCETLIPGVSPIEIALDNDHVGLSGTVTHVEQVTAVEYAIQATESSQWLQPDQTFGDIKRWHSATLGTAQGGYTAWSADLVMAPGDYVVVGRAFDADGDVGSTENGYWFQVRVVGFAFGVIAETQVNAVLPWTFEGLMPLAEDSVLGSAPRDGRGNPIPPDGSDPTVRVSGAAYSSHDERTRYVEVAVQNQSSGHWLQPDGSFAFPKTYHFADIRGALNPAMYWFFDAELPDGRYMTVVRSNASVGLTEDGSWTFHVDNSVAAAPTLAIDQTSGVEFLGDTVRFTGTAADDLGVLEVRYSIRDKDTDLWLSYGTSWRTSRMHHNAVLAEPYTAATEWTVERELPPGRYSLIVEVRDQVLHLGELPDWISFTVEE